MADAAGGGSTPDAPPAGAHGRLLAAAHVGVGALVVFVAFFRIGVADAAPDESTYRSCADSYLHGVWSCNLEHPLLAKELMAIFIAIGGDTITVARLAAALAAVATALWCYLAVRDEVGPVGGLAAAAMWGLLPQAGVEGGTTVEVDRVDRYALLDPFVACFFALAIFLGGRWRRRGGPWYPLLTGAACGAAMCAKAPGILIAPVICLVPLLRRIDAWSRVREAALALTGAEAVLVASYGPLGPVRAAQAIAYMFSYQTSRAARLVVVAGHLVTRAPWWSDLYFAWHGLSAPVAIALAVLVLFALLSGGTLAPTALGASASVLVGVGLGLHLSAPQYWVDWEPGVVVAAAVGLDVAVRHRIARPLAATAALVLLVSAASLVASIGREGEGPYAAVASQLTCEGPCVVAYVAYVNILGDYLPGREWLVAAPPRIVEDAAVVVLGSGPGAVSARPRYVVIDPATFVLHPTWVPAIDAFEADAGRLGYRAAPSRGRLLVFDEEP